MVKIKLHEHRVHLSQEGTVSSDTLTLSEINVLALEVSNFFKYFSNFIVMN